MSFLNSLLRRIPATLSLVFLLALLAIAGLGVRSWLAARREAAKLAATVSAQQKLIDQANTREQQRNARLANALATIARERAAVKTPAQAAVKIPTLLPVLPDPIRIDLPKPQPGQPSPPPAIASIPQPDLKPVYNYLQDCRVCRLKLAADQANLRDQHSQIAALTTQRDAALRAVHGGGFWSHVADAAKWIVIGAAIGAIAEQAAHH